MAISFNDVPIPKNPVSKVTLPSDITKAPPVMLTQCMQYWTELANHLEYELVDAQYELSEAECNLRSMQGLAMEQVTGNISEKKIKANNLQIVVQCQKVVYEKTKLVSRVKALVSGSERNIKLLSRELTRRITEVNKL
jgi:hypothetical protein